MTGRIVSHPNISKAAHDETAHVSNASPTNSVFQSRKQIRLNDYDYSVPGAYFVTICTKDRMGLFGQVSNNEMRLNMVGQIAERCWKELPKHFGNIELDQFVVMPNHVHGIINLLDDPVRATFRRPNKSSMTIGNGCSTVGARHASPLQGTNIILGNVVGSFKSAVTKHINEQRNAPGTPMWQRGYYDHIIRDDRSLNRIRIYIASNPQRWLADKENLKRNGDNEFDRWLDSEGKRSVHRVHP